MELLNIFHSGGAWLIPFALVLAALWSFYRAYRSHNSNSTTTNTGGFQDNTGNVPYTQLPSFWAGVALVVIAIIVFFVIGSDYRGV